MSDTPVQHRLLTDETGQGILAELQRITWNTESTIRPVPFAIATSNWTQTNAGYVAVYPSAYVEATSIVFIEYTRSIRDYATDDIDSVRQSGGNGVVFTTASLPTGTIEGTIYSLTPNDGKIPYIIEGTTIPIENGGTGASSVAGIFANLGLGTSATKNVANNVTTTAEGSVLDARQGKILKDSVTTLSDQIVAYDLGEFSTISGLNTALDTLLASLPADLHKSIRFKMTSASTPFGIGSYTGTLYKAGSTNIYSNAEVTQLGVNLTINGSLNNGTWTWISFSERSVVFVPAQVTIASIAANAYGSAYVDVDIPSGTSGVASVIPRYTSLGFPIAGAYPTSGATSGKQRILVGVYNFTSTARSDVTANVDVIFK